MSRNGSRTVTILHIPIGVWKLESAGRMLNEVRTDHMRCHTSGRDRNERARSSPRPGPPRKPAGKSPRARLPGRVVP